MDATLRNRIVSLEQQFLIAVFARNKQVLEDSTRELSQLEAIQTGEDLDDSTNLLLCRVSRVIRNTTQCMLECEDILKDAQSSLISCLPSDDLLPASTCHSTSTPYPLLFSHASSSGTLGILGHNKLLDACAYRWLMQNMHNPYPTSTQLQIIGDGSMTSVAQVKLWFQEARDLIGWTKLSDEFFTGSLNATITTAKQFYLEHDNTIPFCVAFAFSKVKAIMETLFAERTASPTPLSSHVGCSVVQVQVNDSAHFNDRLDNEGIEDTTPPPSVAGCKRDLPEDTATPLASDLHRPLKRLRCVHFSNLCSLTENFVTVHSLFTKTIPVREVHQTQASLLRKAQPKHQPTH
jgi:hypothetical protein